MIDCRLLVTVINYNFIFHIIHFHISPITGHSKYVTSAIVAELAKLHICLKQLVLIGSNGKNSNTGWKNGVIRQIDETTAMVSLSFTF